jgi:hypothetical protein
MIADIKALDFAEIHRSITQLRVLLDSLAISAWSDIASLSMEFEQHFVRFTKHYNASHTIPLMTSGTILLQRLWGLEAMMGFLLSSLEDPSEASPAEGTLSLLLVSTDPQLSNIIAKLMALQVIAEEIGGLLEQRATLRVIKIESGSLWTKIRGDSNVLSLMKKLIESAVDQFHKKFTRDGRIERIPRQVEAIESVLRLRGRLIDDGIDANGMDDRIKKAGILICEKLNALLVDEPVVEIDGNRYSVGEPLVERYLTEGRRMSTEGTRPEGQGDVQEGVEGN